MTSHVIPISSLWRKSGHPNLDARLACNVLRIRASKLPILYDEPFQLYHVDEAFVGTGTTCLVRDVRPTSRKLVCTHRA